MEKNPLKSQLHQVQKCINQYREVNVNTNSLSIFVGILNMFYQDRGASAVFAKLSNALAKEFPEEKLNQLHGLVLGNTALLRKLAFLIFIILTV